MDTDPLTNYKHAIQQRLDNADLAVSKIAHENSLLSQELNNKQQKLDLLNEQLSKLQEKYDAMTIQREHKQEELDLCKDLFEHLCGIRVHKFYEDDNGLWFDTSQGSQSGIMDYKLGFVKGDGDKTEVVYIPLLKQRTAEELKKLQSQLPNYMFDTLSFPLTSLHQFYNKLSKCLSKNIDSV